MQVALLTERINSLTEHLRNQPKDYSSRRGLLRLVGQRRNFMNYLKKNAIITQVHYIPLPMQPYYSTHKKKSDLRGALLFYEKTLSIPMYTELKKTCIKYIANSINNFFI